jgi:hypothetical protein
MRALSDAELFPAFRKEATTIGEGNAHRQPSSQRGPNDRFRRWDRQALPVTESLPVKQRFVPGEKIQQVTPSSSKELG